MYVSLLEILIWWQSKHKVSFHVSSAYLQSFACFHKIYEGLFA